MAELLAGKTDGRRVDDREEFLEVVDEESIEERLVAILERGQSDVPLEVIGFAANVLELKPTCSSIVVTPGGRSPCKPKASRSTAVKAEPLLRSGRAITSWPLPSTTSRADARSTTKAGVPRAPELTTYLAAADFVGPLGRVHRLAESVRGQLRVSDDPDENSVAVDDREAGDEGGAHDRVGFLQRRIDGYDERVDIITSATCTRSVPISESSEPSRHLLMRSFPWIGPSGP